MPQKWLNNWSTTLAAEALTAATTISVPSAEAAKLGALSEYDFVMLTLEASGTVEIVRATAVSGGNLTVTRGQEGTTAQDWPAGTRIEVRVTAEGLAGLQVDNLASTQFDEDPETTTGLTWGWQAGNLRIDNVIHAIGAGTIGLTASATNYVELDPADQTVKVKQTAFTSGRIPLRELVTDTSSITTNTDRRAWVVGDQVFYGGLTRELPCTGQVVSRPEIKDYGETRSTPSSSAGALTIDLQSGNVAEVTLTEAATISFTNPPATGISGSLTLILHQDATGGRTVTWPASVKWAGGVEPTLSTAASAIDVLTFLTTDAGTTWHGFLAGKGMA